MKVKLISLILLLGYSFLHAQNGFVKQWDMRYGGTLFDGLRAVLETSDKGFIFGGSTFSGLNGDKSQDNWDGTLITDDYWIVKTDSLGVKQWDKRYGGFNYDTFRFISLTKDGGFILGGFSNSDIGGNRTEFCWGGFDYWILKIDSSGNVQWDKRFGGTGDDLLWEVRQTSDGGYILGGFSYSDSSGDKTQPSWGHQDYWIVKTDSIGNKLWDKRYGGGASDILYSLVQTNDGGYLLGGASAPGVGGDYTHYAYGSLDYWVVKIDSIGNKQWDQVYGGTNYEEINSLIRVNDGGFLLGGTTYSGVGGNKTDASKGGTDYWIVKIDSLGNKEWDKDFGGRLNETIVGNVTQTVDSGFLIAGISQSDSSGNKSEDNLGPYQPWIIKTDYFGNLQWDKTLFIEGGIAESNGGFAIQTSDGCYLSANSVDGGVGGYKTQPNWDPTDSTNDMWIIKFCDTIIFTTSVNQVTWLQNQLLIYPNPFASQLSVSLNNPEIKKVRITIKNILGEVLYFDQENNNGKLFLKTFDLGYLPKGFYLFEANLDEDRVVKKVVKQ